MITVSTLRLQRRCAMPFAYSFIGPARLLPAVPAAGTIVRSVGDLVAWLATSDDPVATFTVGLDLELRFAPRRSEHVVCAGGLEVLAAGELAFSGSRHAWSSNQSTGYCPDVDCHAHLVAAAPFLSLPSAFTRSFVFRRCESCAQITVVRQGWLVCTWCSGDLPAQWNVGNRRSL